MGRHERPAVEPLERHVSHPPGQKGGPRAPRGRKEQFDLAPPRCRQGDYRLDVLQVRHSVVRAATAVAFQRNLHVSIYRDSPNRKTTGNLS